MSRRWREIHDELDLVGVQDVFSGAAAVALDALVIRVLLSSSLTARSGAL